MRCLLLLVLIFAISYDVTGQLSALELVESHHKLVDYKKARSFLLKIDTTGFSHLEQSRYLYEMARSSINIDGEMVDSYQTLLRAKKLVKNKDLKLLFVINDELIYSQYALVQLKSTANELMDENCAIAATTSDPKQRLGCNSYNYRRISTDDPQAYQKKLKIQHDSRQITEKAALKDIGQRVLMNIATTHSDYGRYDSALVYYERIKSFVVNSDNVSTQIAYQLNLGHAYSKLDRNVEAIEILKNAIELSANQDQQPYQIKLLLNLATAYSNNEEYEKSIALYNEVLDLINKKNELDRFTALQELETKYQVQERKLENAELTASNERQKVMVLATAGGAVTLLLVSGFFYNNQRKKKRIALQEVELEKQRADNLMKNQELATIDAMIAGQEKERKRLAEELHDNLGSSLTTIRLYFDNLKDHFKAKTSLEIYERTDKLLEDTYSTIRGMSHSRHNGVMASKGLIPSLETLARNITASGRLQVDVYHHGMDRKLENSLELNIFRMLQELLSNVVKHSKATQASINLVGSSDSIHLMVEDDGRGFIRDTNIKKDGMGLNSIETRVEEMDGIFEVDSSAGHGTTISIEIPII